MDKYEFDGWIMLNEKYPPKGIKILIAYRDEQFDEYETLISSYREEKIGGNISVGDRFYLPAYYKQSGVVAWRRLPLFQIN